MSTRLQEKRQQDPGIPFMKRGYPSGFLRRLATFWEGTEEGSCLEGRKTRRL